MKATVVHEKRTGKYFGYLDDIPSVCSQADTLDDLLQSLYKNREIYFRYMEDKEIKYHIIYSYDENGQ